MITTSEIRPGVIEIIITVSAYGDAGKHWQEVLGKRNHGGYGKIYIERFDIKQRRRESLWSQRGDYKGQPWVNLDECPGAMFIYTTDKEVSVEPLDAVSNQALGRALGNALRKYPQNKPEELWEAIFRFI